MTPSNLKPGSLAEMKRILEEVAPLLAVFAVDPMNAPAIRKMCAKEGLAILESLAALKSVTAKERE